MEVCEKHLNLNIDIARIEERQISQDAKLDTIVDFVHQHVKESVPIRDNVRTHDTWIGGCTKFLWILSIGVITNSFATLIKIFVGGG